MKNFKICAVILGVLLIVSVGLLIGTNNWRFARGGAVTMAPPRDTTGVHHPESIVSVAQLKELKARDNVVVVDCSNGPPPTQFIPGAIRIDPTSLWYQEGTATHLIQSLDVHERVLGGNGIGNDTTVIVYCNNPNNMWANRIFWQLRAIGHKDVKTLNGGLNAWIAAGEPTVPAPASPGPMKTYRAHSVVGAIKADIRDVLDATNNPNWTLLDVRSQAEWDGGRVPGAVQFHYPGDMVNADGTFKTVAEYERLFAHIPKDTRLILY